MTPVPAIYIEYLTLKDWIKIFFPLLIRHTSKVYIFDSTAPALIAARCCAFGLGWSIEVMDFKMEEARDSQGLSIFLCILYKEDKIIHHMITQTTEFTSFVEKNNVSPLAQAYLDKELSHVHTFKKEHLKHGDIWHVLVMVQIMRWHQKSTGSTGSLCLYANPRPWFEVLQQYAKDQGVDLRATQSLRLWRWQWLALRQKLEKLNWHTFRILISHLFFKITKKFGLAAMKPYFSTDKIRMMTEHWGHIYQSDPCKYDDLFFLHAQGVVSSDVLVSFGLPMDPLDRPKYEFLCRNNIASIALSPRACAVERSLIDVFEPPAMKEEIALPESVLSGAYGRYKNIRHYWQSLFKKYNIRLYTGWNKYEGHHMAITEAMAELGGISSIYQRSYESHPSPKVMAGADILFGFSSQGHGLEIKNDSRFNYYVVTGYPGDDRFARLRPHAADLRQKLVERGAKHIVAYFDEVSFADGRWFMGHEEARANYAFWLQKVLREPEFGLILKPKRPITLRYRLGEVTQLLDEAIATGRCYIYEEGLVQGSFPPAAAALAADIAIHESLSAGTAGLESALAGVRTLLMDREGWHVSPLYHLGSNVVFTDREKAWKACWSYFKDPQSNHDLGSWSSHLNEFDPFRDGKASMRMSQYLKWLLEGLRQGGSKEDVMHEAAQRYASLWGKDKVHPASTPQMAASSVFKG